MKRVLSLYLPMWPVDLVKRRHRLQRTRPLNQAILIVAASKGQQLVAARCPRADRAGVCVGMSLAHARALLGNTRVTIEPERPQRDAKALERLAQWAIRFSPIVAPDPPDGLLIDITGCQRLFGCERRLLHQLTDTVRRLGFRAQAAIAPTVGCAWAMARYGEGQCSLVQDNDLHNAIRTLPTCSLRIDDQIVEALHEMGVDRVGQLLDLPRSQLPSRFGDQLLLRLDQGLGHAIETIEPFRLREPIRVEQVFDGATTQYEAIEHTTQVLVSQLCQQLQNQERGARSLNLVLERLDVGPAQVSVSLSQPSRNPKHIWALLRPQLEQVNFGFGVEQIALTALRSARLCHVQSQHCQIDSYTDNSSQSGELIDTLTNRLGPDRITLAELLETHIPERVCRYQPIQQPNHHHASQAHPSAAVRPTMLLKRPEPIEVIAVTPDGPVASLRRHGADYRVLSSIGPERISREWWRHAYTRSQRQTKNEKQGRDYFMVQDEQGRWLWVFRDMTTRRWFLHGQWA